MGPLQRKRAGRRVRGECGEETGTRAPGGVGCPFWPLQWSGASPGRAPEWPRRGRVCAALARPRCWEQGGAGTLRRRVCSVAAPGPRLSVASGVAAASSALDPGPLRSPPPSDRAHASGGPGSGPPVCQWLGLAFAHLPLGHRELGPPGATPRGCPALAAMPNSCRGRLGASDTLAARPPGLCASFPVSSPGREEVPGSRTPSAASVSFWPAPREEVPALEVDRCGTAAALEMGRNWTFCHPQTFSGTQQTGCWGGRAHSPWAWGAQPNSANCQYRKLRLMITWRRSVRRLLPLPPCLCPSFLCFLALAAVLANSSAL